MSAGVSREQARELVLKNIDNDPSLESLREAISRISLNHDIEQDVQTLRFITDPKIHYVLLRKCVSLLVLDSVTSTPQWIRQPKPRDIVQKNSSMWPFFNVAWATFNTLSAQEFASAA